MRHQSLLSVIQSSMSAPEGKAKTRSYLEKGSLKILQALHAEFAPLLAKRLSAYLNAPAVSLISMGEVSSDHHCERHAQQPYYQAGFSALQPHAGVMEFSPSLAVKLVDQLLGATHSANQDRTLGEIEVELLRNSAESILATYAELWKRHITYHPSMDGEPEEYRIHEPLYAATYEVHTDGVVGEFCMVMRLPAWREFMAQHHDPAKREPVKAMVEPNTALLGNIGDCLLTARVVLGNTQISVQDLLSLSVGDIICLERSPDAPLEIRVSNRPKLLGSIRVERGQYIVTVESGIARGAR